MRNALDAYRSDPALDLLLTESFVQRMAIFGALLAVWGAKTNLTAHPDDAVETAFHIIDSMMPLVLAKNPNWGELASAFAPGTRILDFGSGAGFPGLILASACDAHFVLAEARQKRASFLKIAAAELDLRNVEVRAGRWSHAAVRHLQCGPLPCFGTTYNILRACRARPDSRRRRSPLLNHFPAA